jgi:DNA polymerase III subunit delta
LADAHKSDRGAKKASLKQAYLILGDDDPKVERALNRLRERILSESGTELNIDEFQAGKHSARDVVAAANTLAFLGGLRLVLVHQVDAWNKADKDEVVGYLRSPAPDACLALVGRKLASGDSLRKAIAAVGDVLEYQAPKPWKIPEWTVEQAGRMGVGLALSEARLLVQRVGDNLHTLTRELEKLSAYKGRAHVTADDIRLLVAPTLEASIFDLVDAVAGRRTSATFTLLEQLYAEGEKPTALFFRLLRHFQQLTRVVAMLDEGWAPQLIQQELKLKPYPAKKLFAQAKAYDADGVREVLGHLAAVEARMKGAGDLPPELELELCLGRLLAASHRPPAA